VVNEKTTLRKLMRRSILKFHCIVNIISCNELRAPGATRDHVLTDLSRTRHAGAQRTPSMLYLKNTLGGLGRSLHDSALNTFQGPNRWWKLALYVVMFVLPGGSLGVLFFAWIDNRRARRDAARAAAAAAKPVALLTGIAAAKAAAPLVKAAIGAASAAAGCQPHANAAPCRAAAGKQARQATADARC
jgi:hypothetical protein